MYPEFTLFDDAFDFGEADFAAVISLQRGTGNESKIVNSEDDCGENRPVAGVEGTVDENVFTSQACGHGVEERLTLIYRAQPY